MMEMKYCKDVERQNTLSRSKAVVKTQKRKETIVLNYTGKSLVGNGRSISTNDQTPSWTQHQISLDESSDSDCEAYSGQYNKDDDIEEIDASNPL